MGNQQNKMINAKLKAKEWQWKLEQEAKTLDREIKKIQKSEEKLRKEIADQAAKGNVSSVQLLAKSVVKSRKTVQRLERTKVSLYGVKLQLDTSIATMSTAMSLRLSSDLMMQMNAIARTPEISQTMEVMRREMAKCADAEDRMEEALMMDGEEEDAAVEVQRVLEEMALDQMGPLARAQAVSAQLQEVAPAAQPAQAVRPERVAILEGEAVPVPKAQPAPAPAAAAQPPAAGGYPAAAPPPIAPAPAPEPAKVDQPPASPAGGEDDDLLKRLAALRS